MNRKIAFGTLAVLLTAGSAMAQVFAGSTTGDPVWTRPVAATPPTGLSGLGTATPYDVLAFTVDITGSYTFQNTAVAAWDNYTFLYQNSFDSTLPLANVLTGNDDNPTIGLSGFAFSLTAGTTYFFVTTGFGNTDSGDYSLSISGQGTATLVPAPGAAALLGLGGLALTRRRRR
jgi:MYXO-CTERM domain-containing protein